MDRDGMVWYGMGWDGMGRDGMGWGGQRTACAWLHGAGREHTMRMQSPLDEVRELCAIRAGSQKGGGPIQPHVYGLHSERDTEREDARRVSQVCSKSARVERHPTRW